MEGDECYAGAKTAACCPHVAPDEGKNGSLQRTGDDRTTGGSGSMDDMRNPLAAPMAQRAARARSTRTFRDARMTACTGDDRTAVTAGAVAAVS